MNLYIKHQESYSRGELLLRTFFGWLYIGIPHGILLFLFGLVAAIMAFLAWFAVLFTGKYPRSFFDYQVKFMAWQMRVQARLSNLVDGYPEFGLDAKSSDVSFSVEYPESLSQLMVLVRLFFGWMYVGIPHGIILYIRSIITMILTFLAWWVVLFTGSYPEGWHTFNVGTIRWQTRVQLYLSVMTDEYPPFSGAP